VLVARSGDSTRLVVFFEVVFVWGLGMEGPIVDEVDWGVQQGWSVRRS
jgi:hypothetical protein